MGDSRIYKIIVENWWLYCICLFVCITLGLAYIHISSPLYEAKAKILVKDYKKGVNVPGTDLFEDLDFMQEQSSVDNEVELLKSRTLMEKTSDALGLYIKYFTPGVFKSNEVYVKNLSFEFSAINLNDKYLTNIELLYKPVENNRFQLKYRDSLLVYKYGDTISFPFGQLSVTTRSAIRPDSEEYLIKILPKDNLVSSLSNALTVLPTSKTVTTIDLSITDRFENRAEAILNTLLAIYDQMNKDDKNRISDSTISFIDDRLSIVSSELGVVESEMQGFRQANELTDIDAQGKLLLNNSSEYFRNLNEQDVQIEIVSSLEQYLKNESNSARLVPATLTIQDPSLVTLVQTYNSMQLDRDRMSPSTPENNPIMQRLNLQIPRIKNDILLNLENIKRAMIINRNKLGGQVAQIEGKIRQVPKKEQIYLEISRQQSIKQELYLYLLKKREETAISKSANVDNSRIVDAAKAQRDPIVPKKKYVCIASVLIGLTLPSLIIYLRSVLSVRVLEKQEITSRTNVPILGVIGHNSDEHAVVVIEGSRSIISEQFRSLRTNLEYLLPEKSDKRILVTSSMSSEGKSFLSINLASAFALSGKKTVLLEFDLRRPRITKALGLKSDVGFSSYVINRAELNEILFPTTINKNLWIIPSGPVPPNPAELLMNPKVESLFKKLSDDFDYIVIDTAPVGLVTDSQILAKFADISLYLVRHGYTYKSQLSSIDEYSSSKKFPKMNLIVNDVKVRRAFGFEYEYGYGYGYGYGYSHKVSKDYLGRPEN
jgi:capsular exopolysaccharide synthesis family protein